MPPPVGKSGRLERHQHGDGQPMKPADPALLLDYYKHHKDFAASSEQTINEITKYNFAAFGAIFLVTAGSFLPRALSPGIALDLACLVVGAISLAASMMTVFYHKYAVVAYSKARVIEKALWRQHSFEYLERKYRDELLPERFAAAMRLGPIEFLRYGYVVQWINLIPLIVAAGLTLTAHAGIVDIASELKTSD